MTPAAVYTLARQAGFTPDAAALMTAIAGPESGYNPNNVGDVALENSTWGPSIGLWQIRSLKAQTGTGGPRDATRLTDPAFNAASAFQIYNTQGLTAWSTYTTGAYKAYLGNTGSTIDPRPSGSSSSGGASVVNASLTSSVGSSIAGSVAGGLWDAIRPALVYGGVVAAGVVLVVIGVAVTALPAVKSGARAAAPIVAAAA